MWKFIDDTLKSFRECFSREAAFVWFVLIVFGLMLRSEHLGVTSIIRELSINPKHYESILHFFKADSWKIENIIKCWVKIIAKSGLLHEVHGQPLLIGDGVKSGKEGRKMPCVKKLHQESENSSKGSYIHGHMFGSIGVLLGNSKKFFCTLLSMRLHDGNSIISEWKGDKLAKESHVSRLVREANRIAEIIDKPCRIALDRYYLSINALTALGTDGLVQIVTKAKKNAVAYEHPVRKPGRGQPPKKGATVKLLDLFSTRANDFTKATLNIYGKMQDAEFLVVDLLWGLTLYKELRFVLVKYQGKTSILVSTDLTLSGEAVIEIYAFRFKIESAFRELKQVIAGFAYRFWTRSMPKLSRFAKNEVMEQKLEAITDTHQKEKIIETFNAIEGFAMFAVIALGIIQMVALQFHHTINSSAFRWLKTVRSDIPSEATTADFLRKSFNTTFHFSPDLCVNRFIREVQSDTDGSSAA